MIVYESSTKYIDIYKPKEPILSEKEHSLQWQKGEWRDANANFNIIIKIVH